MFGLKSTLEESPYLLLGKCKNAEVTRIHGGPRSIDIRGCVSAMKAAKAAKAAEHQAPSNTRPPEPDGFGGFFYVWFHRSQAYRGKARMVGGVGVMATEKQKRFAEGVVRGNLPLVHAYREAYDTNGTPKSPRNEASRLWRNPDVQAQAERIRRDMDAERARKLAADRDRIRERLWSEADTASRASDRLTAAGASAAAVVADIQATLRDALGPEVDPSPEDTPTPPPPLLPERAGSFSKHQNAQTTTNIVDFPTPKTEKSA